MADLGLLQNPDDTRKPCYRKDDRAMRRMYGCPESFRESLTTPTATFPEIVAIDRIEVRTKFEARSFTCSWDNMGYPTNFVNP